MHDHMHIKINGDGTNVLEHCKSQTPPPRARILQDMRNTHCNFCIYDHFTMRDERYCKRYLHACAVLDPLHTTESQHLPPGSTLQLLAS